MIVQVCGIEVPVTTSLTIDVQVEQTGEILPNTVINCTGGKLDVYMSHVQTNGNISLHLFGGDRGQRPGDRPGD